MGNAVLNEVMEANLTDPKPSPDSDMWDGEREKERREEWSWSETWDEIQACLELKPQFEL